MASTCPEVNVGWTLADGVELLATTTALYPLAVTASALPTVPNEPTDVVGASWPWVEPAATAVLTGVAWSL